MPRTRLALAFASLLCLAAPARADLVVTLGNLTLAPGQTGTIPVTITDTANTPVNLSYFSFEFQIATLTGSSRLEFTPTQSAPYYNGTTIQGQPVPYVFKGDSGQAPGSQGAVSTTFAPRDTFIGFDGTADGSDAIVNGNRVLTLLTVTAATGLPPVLGNTFQLKLVPGSNTYFGNDESANPDVAYSVSTGGGLITISSAVPAPPSIVLILLGLAATALYRWTYVRIPRFAVLR